MQKDKALEMALGQIEKQYGKGAIMLMGDAASRIQVSVIPTGCIELDAALGVGGVPRGRIVEIYGPESSGKTTIALHIIAEAQKMGGMCVFIDAEHALDPVYAEKLGISQSAVSQLEALDSRPQKRTREKLAAIYGCTQEQISLYLPKEG